MPLYEFVCEDCGHMFEELIMARTQKPCCPKCGSQSTSTLISAPARMRAPGGEDGAISMASAGGGGCAGCSGGNCASCGH